MQLCKIQRYVAASLFTMQLRNFLSYVLTLFEYFESKSDYKSPMSCYLAFILKAFLF
jgi:hypothetical protein